MCSNLPEAAGFPIRDTILDFQDLRGQKGYTIATIGQNYQSGAFETYLPDKIAGLCIGWRTIYAESAQIIPNLGLSFNFRLRDQCCELCNSLNKSLRTCSLRETYGLTKDTEVEISWPGFGTINITILTHKNMPILLYSSDGEIYS